jgi:site-specific recombinase XerD
MSQAGIPEEDTSFLSIEDAIETYKCEYLTSRNYTQRTRIEYIAKLTQLHGFLLYIGIQKTSQVNRNHLERYLAGLDYKGYAGQTRARNSC